MALSRSRTQDLPSDAVVLSADEALTYQWKIIAGWEPVREVWALRYTPGIIGGLAAITGAYVNSHYRKQLRLGSYGKLSTYLPIVVLPAMFTVLFHKLFVQRDLLLDPLANCPLCLQLRAAAFQGGFGVAYPTVLAPFAAFMYATRHYTYRLPDVTQQPREVFNLWRKFTRPILPVLGTAFAVQAFGAMYLTYKQMDETMQVQLKMTQLERKHEMQLEVEHQERQERSF